MIPASTGRKNVPAWQRELARAIRSPDALLEAVGLSARELDAPPVETAFPMRVPRPFVARMRRGDPHDPLLAQVLPTAREHARAPGFGPDPVDDAAAMAEPGVLHKYHGRVLLVTTGACAVNCRYCFRREFPYGDANPKPGGWQRALRYIADDPSIGEVILSGGDPLSLPDATLAELVAGIEAIPHVTTLRLHTRLPVVLPARVDDALAGWLARSRLDTVVVLHANHAQELDDDVAAACARLRAAAGFLLNQAVLLAGINDTPDAQEALARRLFACGVLPYYLHLLDPVRGAAHFDVDDESARRLLAEVGARLPGYLLPRLVREEPGRPGKTPLPLDWRDAQAAPPENQTPSDGASRGAKP